MQGLHLTADLYDCSANLALMTDAQALLAALVQAVQASGLQAVAQLAHQFPCSGPGAGGVTASVLLTESHACIHTWPEQSCVSLDVYVCNFGADNSGKARLLLDLLQAMFAPKNCVENSLQRGRS